MAGFWRGPCSLSCLWSWSGFWCVHSWVQFLSVAEASPGLPGAAWKQLVGHQCPSTQLWEIQYQFCIFCIISLISNIISIITKNFYIQFVSLSPFSSFSFPLVGERGLIESICHSVFWRPALNCDTLSLPDFSKVIMKISKSSNIRCLWHAWPQPTAAL